MGEMSKALRRSMEERTEREHTFVPYARRTRGHLELAPEPRSAPRFEPSLVHSVQTALGVPAQQLPAPDPSFFAASASRFAIPRKKKGLWQPRCVALPKGGIDAESFRHLAVRVTRELAERNVNTLLVTSAVRGEGKTTVACNLALALASLSAGKPVALVDLDLRTPDLAKIMDVTVTNGIETVLRGENPLRSRRARSDFHALDTYFCGTPQTNVHALLSSAATAAAIRELSTHYETVIIDSPPVISTHDAALMMSFVGACLPVVKRGVTRHAVLEEALGLLPQEKSIGVFFNRCSPARYRRGRV